MSFHIFKAEKAQPVPQKQRRRRRTISCVPCRQLKVSCDRKTPCSRCVWRHKVDECTYIEFQPQSESCKQRLASRGSASLIASRQSDFHIPEANTEQSSTTVSDGERAEFGANFGGTHREPPWYTPKSALRGATHWAGMLHQFQDVLPDNEESRTILEAHLAKRPPDQLRGRDVALLEKFPFTCIGYENSSFDKSDVVNRLPARQICDLFVEQYLRSSECIHRLFHIPTLKAEIASFWQDPLVSSYSWLAQLFLTLIIGCEASRKGEEITPADASVYALWQSLLESAEMCLSRTSMLFRTDQTLIRCLCLAVIVKSSGVYQCSVIDSCGPLTDMAIRGCLELGLQSATEKGTILDQQIRARLWNTAVFLKVQQAANSGTLLLLRRCDFGPCTLRNLDDDKLANGALSEPEYEYTESICEIILSRAIPIAIEVVSAVNSTNSAITTLHHCQKDIQRLLHDVHAIYSNPQSGEETEGWYVSQRHMLEIFLRRISLIIDQSSLSLSPDIVGQAHSQQQFLGSALAIMVHQRQLLENGQCAALSMIAELYKQDFFVAAVGACMALKRCQQGTVPGLELAAFSRDTILESIYWCKEIWLRDVHISTCNYWAYLILERLYNGLAIARTDRVGKVRFKADM